MIYVLNGESNCRLYVACLILLVLVLHLKKTPFFMSFYTNLDSLCTSYIRCLSDIGYDLTYLKDNSLSCQLKQRISMIVEVYLVSDNFRKSQFFTENCQILP